MLSPGKPADRMPISRRGARELTNTLPPHADAQMPQPNPSSDDPGDQAPAPRRNGYGLPCTSCRTYYPADLSCCPVCQTPQHPLTPTANQAESGDGFSRELEAIEMERERFVQEFRLRFAEPGPRAEAEASAPTAQVVENSACCLQENHQDGSEPACVCQDCYRGVLARIDVVEAALQMDAREAAQIVYEAVWTDPSDPSRTYENAARALLSEIRRRAGVGPVFGSLRPFTH